MLPVFAGYDGRWMLQLFDPNEGSCNRAEGKCLDWLSKARDGKHIRDQIQPCPCDINFAWLDTRFK